MHPRGPGRRHELSASFDVRAPARQKDVMGRASCLRRFGSILAGVSVAACGADGFSGGAAYPDEPTAELTTALAESACWDAAPDSTIVAGASGSFDAPSAKASSEHSGCAHRFVVDVTNVLGKSVAVSAGSGGIPHAGREWCAGYWSENEAQGCRGTPCTWS